MPRTAHPHRRKTQSLTPIELAVVDAALRGIFCSAAVMLGVLDGMGQKGVRVRLTRKTIEASLLRVQAAARNGMSITSSRLRGGEVDLDANEDDEE